eukprot:GEZU01000806.1.p1 GENE.GEZU01000806.1~~GEZU01000806.1.p1  ORF type:complete len:113 (-),score=37.05 GEZU01000806.1:117-455(-)
MIFRRNILSRFFAQPRNLCTSQFRRYATQQQQQQPGNKPNPATSLGPGTMIVYAASAVGIYYIMDKMYKAHTGWVPEPKEPKLGVKKQDESSTSPVKQHLEFVGRPEGEKKK